MPKVWIGGLSKDVAVDNIQKVLDEHGLIPSDIQLKRGYAFVEFPNQETADSAISQLKGTTSLGSAMQVEPSMSANKANSQTNGGRRMTNKIALKNLPSYVNREEVKGMCDKYGTVQKIEQTAEGDGQFIVTFESPDQAQQAVDAIHGQDYQGQCMKVHPLFNRDNRERKNNMNRNNDNRGGNGNDNRNDRDRGDRRNMRRKDEYPLRYTPQSNEFMHRKNYDLGGRPGPNNQRRKDEYPLRILVKSDCVGAVIGSKGVTITEITKRCKAGVDVLRQSKEEKFRLPETPIFIYGNPENASNACKEILSIVQNETKEDAVVLKLLVEDRHCGSIIGKGGKNIKTLRENSCAKIHVSQQNPHPFNWDRIIEIRGSLENVCEAEKEISQKVCACHQNEKRNEFQPMIPVQYMMPHAHGGPGGMGGYGGHGGGNHYMNHSGRPYLLPPKGFNQGGHMDMHNPLNSHDMGLQTTYQGGHNFPNQPFQGGYGNQMVNGGMQGPYGGMQQEAEEETFIKVPDGAASIIIGPKGNNIRQIKAESGAYIHIDPEKKDKNDPTPPRIPEGVPVPKDPKMRVITVRGCRDAQWKAHLNVFTCLKAQGFAECNDEVRLTVMMKVPCLCVGKVIGKQGHNVKTIQKQTGAIVKLPDGDSSVHSGSEDYKFVEVTGSYTATQAALCRIKSKINPQGNGGGFQNERGYQNERREHGGHREGGHPGHHHEGHHYHNGK